MRLEGLLTLFTILLVVWVHAIGVVEAARCIETVRADITTTLLGVFWLLNFVHLIE